MLTRVNNEKGIISYDEALIDQIVQEALRPYKGQVWLAHYKGSSSDLTILLGSYESLAEKLVKMTERGVFVRLYLLIKIGTSISEASRSICFFVADAIRNQLQLPLDNVEIVVSGMVSKNAVKRDIRFDYRSLAAETAPVSAVAAGSPSQAGGTAAVNPSNGSGAAGSAREDGNA